MTAPTSVRALQRVTATPFLLAMVLVTLMLVGGAYLLATSVRARRRDLAVLRALGSDRGQQRAIIHWHATLSAAFALVIGFPIGVVAGRWVGGWLTSVLGIVPGIRVPVLLLFGTMVAALLVANALALLPARRAAAAEVRTPLHDH